MLVHLKQQKVLPTIFLTLFYFFFNAVLAAVILILLFALFILTSRLFFISFYREILRLFFISRYIFALIAVIGIPVVTFKVSRKIQKNFFKKYPLTPLFMIVLPVLGGLVGILSVYFWVVFQLLSGS